MAESQRPSCPKWLSKEGKAAWRQLVPMLEGMGVLTKVDANAVARYCNTWVRWKAAVLFLAEKGEVYTLKDDAGNIRCLQQFPQVGIANRLAHQLGQMEQTFGMTPSARTRVHVLPEDNGGLPTRNRYSEGGGGKSRFFAD